MAGPFRARIFGVAVKIETPSGTDAVPDPAVDSVQLVGTPKFVGDYLEPGTRDDVVNGVLINADKTEAAGRFGKISITVEVRAGASLGVGPDVDALLRMSGMSKTVIAVTSVRYSTIDTGMETASVYCWSANKLFKLVGCVATMKLASDAAKRGFYTFEITGRLAADPTEVALPAQSFSAKKPLLFHSAAASIGAWTSGDAEPVVIKSAAVDLQNTIAERPSAGATDGLIGYAVTDRKTQQSMTIEAVSLTAFDPFTLSKSAGSAQPVSAWQLGQAAADRVKVLTGKWSVVWPDIGDSNSLVTYGINGSLGAGATGATTRELSLLYD